MLAERYEYPVLTRQINTKRMKEKDNCRLEWKR